MAPRRAAQVMQQEFPHAHHYTVTLYGSLAATGKGHLTDRALTETLAPCSVDLTWLPDERLPDHPNGMRFVAFDPDHQPLGERIFYSLGGGALNTDPADGVTYPDRLMNEILKTCQDEGQSFWEYVEQVEGNEIWSFLEEIWTAMQRCIDNGLEAEGRLPGILHLPRRACSFMNKARLMGPGPLLDEAQLAGYAYAVSEENAGGGLVVTAPTCGACGVVPALFHHLQKQFNYSDRAILRALATAGLFGNIAKHNGSISGAEVGCQGEVGVACAMAAAGAAQLLGGSPHQIEYAAEMGLEHHLGLTCDPVAGLVQIPCIERNAHAAARALSCARFALLSDGQHRICYDDVITVMTETGRALPDLYRETSTGGLARVYLNRLKNPPPV